MDPVDYRTLVDNLAVVVFQADATGNWTFLNPAWSQLTGYAADAVAVRTLSDCVHPDDQPACRHFFQSLTEAPRQGRQVELRLLTSAGDVRWVEVFANPTVDANSLIVGSTGMLADITARKAAEARIERLAYQDPLTTLPNRTSVLERLDWALAAAKRDRRRVAVLFMDLDGFKDINDTFGHHIGDRALREVAQMLRAVIRPYDICVRYAGDEFIVVLAGCGREEAENKKVELQQAIDRVVFEPRPGNRLPLSISAGAAVFPHDGDSYESLLAKADSRMYRDKSLRKQDQARQASTAAAADLQASPAARP